jgi:CheY-like chemotaxis protein
MHGRTPPEPSAQEQIEALLQRGLEFYGRSFVNEAILCWRRVLELDPREARALDYLQTVGADLSAAPVEDRWDPATVTAPQPAQELHALFNAELVANAARAHESTLTNDAAALSQSVRDRRYESALTLLSKALELLASSQMSAPPRAAPSSRPSSVPAPPVLRLVRPSEAAAPRVSEAPPAVVPSVTPSSATPIVDPSLVPSVAASIKPSAAPTAPPSALPASAPATPRRVLVVDENPTQAAMIQVLLGAHGHEYVTATSGPAAVEAARNATPDVIVMAFMIPGCDGVEAARQMRAIESLARVPIFLTATRLEANFVRPRLASVRAELLQKPISREEIVKRTEAWLKR